MSSIVDDTNLPTHIPGILAKRPEDRTPIEQATVDAYNKKLGPNGAEKVGEVAAIEARNPAKGKQKVCARTGLGSNCKNWFPGPSKCAICNPSGKN
jgi:hypothetical protein